MLLARLLARYLKVRWITVIGTALLNEFNASHYKQRDMHGKISRRRPASNSPHNHTLRKKRTNVVFAPRKILESSSITY